MELPADCHTKIVRVFDYWRSIHPAVGLPGRRGLDPLQVPEGLLPNMSLIDVTGDPRRFRYRLIGTSITRFAGRDVSGRWLEDVYTGFAGGGVHTALCRVVDDRTGDYRRGPPVHLGMAELAEVERIFLPLADDGASVDMIMALAVFHDTQGRAW